MGNCMGLSLARPYPVPRSYHLLVHFQKKKIDASPFMIGCGIMEHAKW